MAMWLFSSPGWQPGGSPGAGYHCAPRASLSIPARSSASRPNSPAPRLSWDKRGRECCSAGCHCPVPPTTACCSSQMRFYLSLEIKTAAPFSAAHSPCCCGGEQHLPAHLNLQLLGPPESVGDSLGLEPPWAGGAAFVPTLSPGHTPAALQAGLGHTSLAPPGTAATSCLLQIFCPERVNISFPESRITFLRVGFWTFY